MCPLQYVFCQYATKTLLFCVLGAIRIKSYDKYILLYVTDFLAVTYTDAVQNVIHLCKRNGRSLIRFLPLFQPLFKQLIVYQVTWHRMRTTTLHKYGTQAPVLRSGRDPSCQTRITYPLDSDQCHLWGKIPLI